MDIFYATFQSHIPILINAPIYCAASVIFIYFLTKTRIDIVIATFSFSFGIGYILYYIASFIIGILFMPFASSDYISGSTINYNTFFNLIFYSSVSVFQFLLCFLLFRIKRFKKGFPFLLKGYVLIITLIITGSLLILITWIKILTVLNDVTAKPLLLTGILIIGIGIYIWIKRGIKMFYKRKMNERSIEIYEQELLEKEQEIQLLREQNDSLRIANHKINHRLSALEYNIYILNLKMQKNSFSLEINEELSAALKNIKHLSQEYQEGVNQVKRKKPLPVTKIKMIDDLFEYFSKQCMINNIDFNLIISGSIPYMTEYIIPQSKLEILIGDHLQDALVAVNISKSSFRNILAVLGLAGDYYEFTVFDSGIPFEIDTLMRLGTEYVTTHTDIGGNGIGFMTTFETLKVCNASLIVIEKIPSTSDYSKSVTIRFDGKNKYIIKTFRPNDFPQNDRYQVICNEVFVY